MTSIKTIFARTFIATLFAIGVVGIVRAVKRAF